MRRLSRLVKIQLAIFTIIAIIAGSLMLFGYIRIGALLGVAHYKVNVDLPDATGLYAGGNVTYRGTEVGRIEGVRLTANGAQAALSLESKWSIPADVEADVHSASGIGEQYIALQPRSGNGPPLKDGATIPQERTSMPPSVSQLLEAANRGVEAIPRDNVKTVVDEAFTAVGGLGPELYRIVRGGTQLAIDARTNLDPVTALIDKSGPVLDSQADSSANIQAWAEHLSDLTQSLKANDTSVARVLKDGPAAADEARQLVERVNPTLPILMANLVALNPVLLTYQPAIEQVLVLLPQGVATEQSVILANKGTGRQGFGLSFNLNINLPPPCTTGYLPAQQRRSPAATDNPDLPTGNFYCRIPQDSPNAVRGARNYPCLAKPGKRAPTAQMCESDEQYVPLNDGNNWKGDPNATVTGQDVPSQDSRTVNGVGGPFKPATPLQNPIPVAMYDPDNGVYLGTDGRTHRIDLKKNSEDRTWQSMLIPQTMP